MKNRLVGAAVLIGLCIAVPLILVQCSDDEAGADSMRIYDLTSGGMNRSNDRGAADDAASTDAANGQGTDSTAQTQPASADDEAPARPDAISPAGSPPEPEDPPRTQAQAQAESGAPADSGPSSAAAETSSSPSESAPPSAASANTPSNAGGDGRALRRDAAFDGGWIVQVASFRQESNAGELANRLSTQYDAFYTAGDVDGVTYYRVAVGPFSSESAAQSTAANLRSAGRSTLVRRAP